MPRHALGGMLLALALALAGMPAVLWAAPGVLPAPAGREAPLAAGPVLDVVTFNLHHDRDDWRRCRRVILSELERLQPDAIALQEVIQKPGVRNQARWLAKRLGYEYLFVSTDPPGARKRYGNASLTRRTVLARGEQLLHPLEDYRTVAYLRIEVEGRPVNLYATHLNERDDADGHAIRRRQVEDLLRYVRATASDAPVVIAGDFNAMVDAGDLGELRSQYGDSYGSVHVDTDLAAVSTLNLHYYRVPTRIDHIFFQQQRVLARQARLLFDRPAANGVWASDHYGVWARLQLAAEP